MQIIAHRLNLVSALRECEAEYGVEVDIRSNGSDLIIHHDPLVGGVDFKEWLKHYRHKTLILNVKEEGLEEPLIELMDDFGISDFFFLDQSFPFLIKWSKLGFRKAAVRVSEYESIDTALALSGYLEWVWVDFFTKFPLSSAEVDLLRRNGFRVCIVSPELQGFDPEVAIPQLRCLLESGNMIPDAVCTKRPDLWRF